MTTTAAPAAKPQCLPRDISDFTGRDSEVVRLLSIAGRTAGRPDDAGSDTDRNRLSDRQAPARVVVVTGMAGIGKATLVVHAGHRLTREYPDGQLFVDLRGHSDQDPIADAEALGMLLRQLGVPGDQLPSGLEDRIALWWTELANRRVLVVLDNVACTAQASPLLPGGSPSTTLVTSRWRLTGLDGADLVSLGRLSHGDAMELLSKVVGDRVSADPTAAPEVIRLWPPAAGDPPRGNAVGASAPMAGRRPRRPAPHGRFAACRAHRGGPRCAGGVDLVLPHRERARPADVPATRAASEPRCRRTHRGGARGSSRVRERRGARGTPRRTPARGRGGR